MLDDECAKKVRIYDDTPTNLLHERKQNRVICRCCCRWKEKEKAAWLESQVYWARPNPNCVK